MVTLTSVHIVYLLLIILFLALMLLKKSIVVPCAGGILIISYLITNSVVKSFQALFNTLVWAGTELFGIITVIAIVVAMTSALREIGADQLIVRPLHKVVRGPRIAFFILGLVMFVVSLCIWPSPAVALVGALLLPIAVSTGMPVIWAAVAMNLFGHGIALSGDFFIQGAPTITAKAADTSVGMLISGYLPLWIIMSLTVIIVSFLMFRQDTRNITASKLLEEAAQQGPPISGKAAFLAVLTPIVFLLDIALMLAKNLQGGDATALIGGTAFVILVLADTISCGPKDMLDAVGEHIKGGFSFGIQIFAPVIVIGGFFFLGAQGAAQAVYGPDATGILSDVGTYLAQNVPLSKFPVVLAQAAVSVITGLDGSGFSGLPLIGATAATFSNALPVHKEILAGMGQLVTIWIGGGTIIPWAVIPVAAICNVSPEELVRKNLIPVLCGIGAVVVSALILA